MTLKLAFFLVFGKEASPGAMMIIIYGAQFANRSNKTHGAFDASAGLVEQMPGGS